MLPSIRQYLTAFWELCIHSLRQAKTKSGKPSFLLLTIDTFSAGLAQVNAKYLILHHMNMQIKCNEEKDGEKN